VKKHEAKIYSKSEDMKHFLNFMNTLICVTVSVITNTCLTLVGCVLISSWLMVAWVRKLMSYVFERKQMFFNLLQWLEYAENEFGDTIWNYVYWAIRTAGPVYTKFIHRITCRLHMFPKWMRLRCEKLQTDVPPHAYAFSVALVNKALKENGAGCHVWIDPVAIGTGCVAQVHRGILQNENGFHIVAVKVLHPDIQKKLERGKEFIYITLYSVLCIV
jgi:predicted unusual protein kinase regulating ubiquinone biosynthesis (AarF/ABC1/UbiB family)